MKKAMTSIKAIFGLLLIAVASVVGVVTFGAARASASGAPVVIPNAKISAEDSNRCTMAVPQVRATVEVRLPHASDFCEIASQVLVANVFRAPVLVTPGVLWHYSGTALSCRLRYKKTQDSMTVRQSAAACHWLLRLGRGWHMEAPVGAGTASGP
jgi:hypothetical protein